MSASSVFSALTVDEQRTLLAFFRLEEADAARCAQFMSTDEDQLAVAGDQLLGLGVTLQAGRVCKAVLGDDIHASATNMKVFGENETIAHFVRIVLFAGTCDVCNVRSAHTVCQLFEALLAISSLFTVRSGGGVDRLRVTEQIVGDFIDRLLRSVCAALESQVPLPEIRRRLQNDIGSIRELLQAASAAAQAAVAARAEQAAVLSTDDYYAWCQQHQTASRPGSGGQHPPVRIGFITRSGVDGALDVRMCCGQLAAKCRCDPTVPPMIVHAGRLLLERLSRNAAVAAKPIARWSCCRAVVVDTAGAVLPVLECKPSGLAAAAAAAAAAQGCEKPQQQ